MQEQKLQKEHGPRSSDHSRIRPVQNAATFRDVSPHNFRDVRRDLASQLETQQVGGESKQFVKQLCASHVSVCEVGSVHN